MKQKTVLLVFGGESSEHEVSILSARNVYAAISNSTFEVILVYIDKRGIWWLLDQMTEKITTHGALQLLPVLGSGHFVTLPSGRVITPDIILPILHGKNGEDGSVQGLAQLLHIPIVGCDMTASSLCMDKIATKEVLEANKIVVVPYETHRRGTTVPDFKQLSHRLGSPLFVKPARAGSSVGVSKINSSSELIRALDLAHRHDDMVLIEMAVVGRELEVAMLGNPPNQKASAVGEIKPGDEFYNYDAKYANNSKSQTIIPAELDVITANYIRQQASTVYELLGCKGLARVDFFLADDGALYVNEVNTLPGFTNISMYPKLWQARGLSYPQLIERLISLAQK